MIKVDLSNVKAVRFKASIGADYPLGDESRQRKTYANRVTGKEARFLTLIEPHQGAAKIRSATATSADTLRVELTDGRVHEIQIDRLTGSGKDIGIKVTETKDSKTLREETTTCTGSGSACEDWVRRCGRRSGRGR